MPRFKVEAYERRLYRVTYEVDADDEEHARELATVGEVDAEFDPPRLERVEYRLVTNCEED